MDKIFGSIFTNSTVSASVGDFILCLVIGLACGLILAVLASIGSRFSKSFKITIAILPAVVGLVIMLVNGNLGAGIAVAGAFSLVRFRSAPGTAKEICAIFVAMASGLAIGMGFLGYAVLFTILIGGLITVMSLLKIGEKHKNCERMVKITIPEDLDYTKVFDEVFDEYVTKCGLEQVKTTNFGSMFKLTYRVQLINSDKEKELIDKLRTRNGNLEVMISRMPMGESEL